MSAPAPAVRSARERVLQTLCYEGVGIVLVAPLYGLCAGAAMRESVVLLGALSLAMMAWSACFNTVCDHLEARLARRAAHERPQGWRAVHALLHEATALVVTWPLIVALTDLDWSEALVAELLLTLVYAGYAYLFHRVFDWLRPVRPRAAQAGVERLRAVVSPRACAVATDQDGSP